MRETDNLDRTPGRLTTMYVYVFETLRDEILSGSIKPGDRIIIDEIESRLGVSRTPVREALKQLSTMGLVESKPHRGTYVKSMSYDEIIEIYIIRAAIEGAAARLAAPIIADSDILHLKSLCNRMEDEIQDLGHTKFRELNREFHNIIRSVNNTPLLNDLARQFYQQSGFTRALSIELPGGYDMVCKEHRSIVEALKSRNTDLADEVTKRHFLNTANRIARSMGKEEKF